jgi:hypothetical protein
MIRSDHDVTWAISGQAILRCMERRIASDVLELVVNHGSPLPRAGRNGASVRWMNRAVLSVAAADGHDRRLLSRAKGRRAVVAPATYQDRVLTAY